MRHPDTPVIPGGESQPLLGFKFGVSKHVSHTLLHSSLMSASHKEMRICTRASQHAAGTVSWPNVCLEDVLFPVLGLEEISICQQISSRFSFSMCRLTGWQMSTRCAEQWAENVRCNWPLAAAPKRPRNGYHQASHAPHHHQSTSHFVAYGVRLADFVHVDSCLSCLDP